MRSMGSGGGLWPDEGLTGGRECAIIKDTKSGVIHAVASLGCDSCGDVNGFRRGIEATKFAGQWS